MQLKPKRFCKACSHNEIYHQWTHSDESVIWIPCNKTGCDCKEFTLLKPKKADSKKTKEDKVCQNS